MLPFLKICVTEGLSFFLFLFFDVPLAWRVERPQFGSSFHIYIMSPADSDIQLQNTILYSHICWYICRKVKDAPPSHTGCPVECLMSPINIWSQVY